MTIHSDFGAPLIPPPLTADVTGPGTVTAKGALYTGDTLSMATGAQAVRILVNLEADKPVPPGVTPEGLASLASLGRDKSLSGPSGLGNPWLVANPTVAFSLAFLDVFRAMRESKSQMGDAMTQQIGITMDLAKLSADLAMKAAEKERDQHIVDAVVAGVQMGVSLAGAAVAVGVAIKSLRGSSPEMDEAKADVDKAKTSKGDLEGEQKSLEAEQHRLQADIDKNTAKIKAEEAKVSTDSEEMKGIGKTKENLAKTQTDLENQMTEIKKSIEAKKDQLAKADEILNTKQEIYTNAEKRFQQQIERVYQVLQPLLQAATKAADMGGSIAKAGLSIQKGLIEAEKQITQGQQEILRRINDTISQSYSNNADAINQLLQSLKKMEDELVRSMSMTRN